MKTTLRKSQKYMVYAYVLLFAAQFFSFGTDSYYYTTTGGGFTLTNEAKVEHDGWHYHAWWIFVPAFAFALYIFYTRYPKMVWWWAALAFCIIAGFGGVLGFVSMLVAGYAVYLKRTEDKEMAQVKTEAKA